MRIDGRKLLGLTRSASSKEVKERCEGLLEWLETVDIPDKLEPWLWQQQTMLRGLYEHPELVNEQTAAEARPHELLQKAKVSEARRVGKPALLTWFLARPVAMAIVGIVIGLGVLSAILLSGVFDNGGDLSDVQQGGLTEAEIAANQAEITRLEETIKSDPKNPQMLFDLGELNITNGNWAESIKWFTQLLAVEPDNLHAQIDIGTANLQLGNYQEAKDALVKVLAVDPENVSAHYNMGFLEAFRSDAPNLDEAKKHFEEVVRLAPGSDQAEVAQVHLDQIKAETGTASN